jgi:hypothetical protein
MSRLSLFRFGEKVLFNTSLSDDKYFTLLERYDAFKDKAALEDVICDEIESTIMGVGVTPRVQHMAMWLLRNRSDRLFFILCKQLTLFTRDPLGSNLFFYAAVDIEDLVQKIKIKQPEYDTSEQFEMHRACIWKMLHFLINSNSTVKVRNQNLMGIRRDFDVSNEMYSKHSRDYARYAIANDKYEESVVTTNELQNSMWYFMEKWSDIEQTVFSSFKFLVDAPEF